MANRILPIGIQSFEKLRKHDCVYVDKTEYIYKQVHSPIPCFLSRPRRFGKSLLLSTLKSYWEGKKELFKDLVIERLEKNNGKAWQPYPVFNIDFNREGYQEEGNLEKVLDALLKEWEEQYTCEALGDTLAIRFQSLLKKVSDKTGMLCVVLVDEYDKPLLDPFENQQLAEHNREVLKGFFGCLKSHDAYSSAEG